MFFTTFQNVCCIWKNERWKTLSLLWEPVTITWYKKSSGILYRVLDILRRNIRVWCYKGHTNHYRFESQHFYFWIIFFSMNINIMYSKSFRKLNYLKFSFLYSIMMHTNFLVRNCIIFSFLIAFNSQFDDDSFLFTR